MIKISPTAKHYLIHNFKFLKRTVPFELNHFLTLQVDKNMSADVIKLQDENSALKDQVKRLIKELSTCQETLGIKSSSSDSHSFEFEIHDESFDCGTIAPLFTAYDHRIKELSSFIDRQGSVLDLLTQRSTDLLSENENLRKRIIQGLPNKNNDIKKECENDQLKVTNVKNLLSDNSLLEEQATLLVKELNDAHVVIRCRDETISSLTDQVRSKLKLIHNLNDKVQLLIKEKGICETELASQIKEITTQKNYIDDLKDCVDKLNREQSQMSSQVDQTGIDKCCLETENEALTMNVCSTYFILSNLFYKSKFILYLYPLQLDDTIRNSYPGAETSIIHVLKRFYGVK